MSKTSRTIPIDGVFPSPILYQRMAAICGFAVLHGGNIPEAPPEVNDDFPGELEYRHLWGGDQDETDNYAGTEVMIEREVLCG